MSVPVLLPSYRPAGCLSSRSPVAGVANPKPWPGRRSRRGVSHPPGCVGVRSCSCIRLARATLVSTPTPAPVSAPSPTPARMANYSLPLSVSCRSSGLPRGGGSLRAFDRLPTGTSLSRSGPSSATSPALLSPPVSFPAGSPSLSVHVTALQPDHLTLLACTSSSLLSPFWPILTVLSVIASPRFLPRAPLWSPTCVPSGPTTSP